MNTAPMAKTTMTPGMGTNTVALAINGDQENAQVAVAGKLLHAVAEDEDERHRSRRRRASARMRSSVRRRSGVMRILQGAGQASIDW